MELKVTKSDLLKVLGAAFRAVPSKTSTPILENFLFAVKDNVLTVTASDIDITVTAKTNCEGKDGAACVPAKTLVDLVRTLPNGDITIVEENGQTTVDWGRGRSNFPSFPVADFPEVKRPEGERTSLSKDGLKAALKHTIANTSEDSLRPVMGGIYFDPKDEAVNLVASDSHTLAVYPVEGNVEHSFILPAKAAAFIKDNLSGDGDVTLSVDDNAVTFDLDDMSVYSRTIVGHFPKYEAVIPQNNGCELKGKVDAMKEVVSRVASCANKASKFIKLTLDILGVEMEGQDLGFNCSANEVLDDFTYNGNRIVIGFKYDYLLRLLNACDGNELVMSFADSRKAVLIKCEDDPCEAIIMPVMIQ